MSVASIVYVIYHVNSGCSYYFHPEVTIRQRAIVDHYKSITILTSLEYVREAKDLNNVKLRHMCKFVLYVPSSR